jgi:hypothetical protein
LVLIVRGLLALAILLMAGCATVHIHNATITEERYPGLLILKVAPLSGAFLIQTQGGGLVASGHSLTLGYLKETIIMAPDASECRLIIVAKNSDEVKSILQSVGRMGSTWDRTCSIIVGENQ